MKFRYTPPNIIQKIFHEFTWKSKCEKILLTFDDGPNPDTTEKILEKLKEYNSKAAFFCVGENVELYPDITRNIFEAGHTICNHSQSHNDITGFNRKEIENQITQCSEAIKSIIGVSPFYFRPPHGRFDFGAKKILKKNLLTNVLWSLLTYDYKNDLNIVKFAVQNYLAKDSIIVLHDSDKSKDIITSAIDFIFEEAEKNGFEIGEPEECLK